MYFVIHKLKRGQCLVKHLQSGNHIAWWIPFSSIWLWGNHFSWSVFHQIVYHPIKLSILNMSFSHLSFWNLQILTIAHVYNPTFYSIISLLILWDYCSPKSKQKPIEGECPNEEKLWITLFVQFSLNARIIFWIWLILPLYDCFKSLYGFTKDTYW